MAVPGWRTPLSLAEYLAIEAASDVRHEFVDGELVLRSCTQEHALVATALMGTLGMALVGKPCRPRNSDARIYFPASGDTAYPDLSVVCGRAECPPEDPDAITNPTVVVEVLSPTTENWDRGGKFERYETLPSLREYALVSVERQRVELFRRNDDGTFLRIVFGPGDTVEFRSLAVTFSIGALYTLVDAERAAAAET